MLLCCVLRTDKRSSRFITKCVGFFLRWKIGQGRVNVMGDETKRSQSLYISSNTKSLKENEDVKTKSVLSRDFTRSYCGISSTTINTLQTLLWLKFYFMFQATFILLFSWTSCITTCDLTLLLLSPLSSKLTDHSLCIDFWIWSRAFCSIVLPRHRIHTAPSDKECFPATTMMLPQL